MLYSPLAAPFVSAALTLFLAVGCFGEPAVRAWDLAAAARFAGGLWLASAGHGIWLDYTVYRVSWRIPANFWCGSLAAAMATAVALTKIYGGGGG